MLHTLKLAFRNILRNKRRTAATLCAIMLSCGSLILLGGYMRWTHKGGEIHAIGQVAHIQVFRKGFQDQGAGNPAGFAIDGYARVRKILLDDPVLRPMLEMATGQLIINGLVSSAEHGTSTPFVGIGVFPEEYKRLQVWNPYGITDPRTLPHNAEFFAGVPELDVSDPTGGSLGMKLAGILGIDTAVSSVPSAAEDGASGGGDGEESGDSAEAGGIPGLEIVSEPAPGSRRPSVELLSLPPSGGMPNMTTLRVRRAAPRATKDLDSRLVKLTVGQASELIYPGEELKVTSIMLLLKRTVDIPRVSRRLDALIRERGLDLEFMNWEELLPDYRRSFKMFSMFFVFMLCVISVVLVFTIFNTIYMGVVERTNEIGTLRAMGMTRGGIMTGLFLEGLVLGVLGGLLGVCLGLGASWAVNAVQIVYQPPMVPYLAPLEVMGAKSPGVIALSFSGCVVVATMASLPAARRAARMAIADALRH